MFIFHNLAKEGAYMNIKITSNDNFYSYVAKQMAQQVLRKPDSVLCVATGTTTKPIFDELVKLKNEFNIDFSKAFAFNVDEYVGVCKEDPASCHWRIRDELYAPVGLEDRYYVPSAAEDDMEAGLKDFREVLDRLQGIDLMLLNVGGNGHIAFNEPGTPFESDLYIANISQNTIKAKAEMFGGEEKVPRYGITMGIRSIMQARKILFVACGAHKADIMKTSLYGPVTPDVPASVLQLHPFVDVVVDKSAGAGLLQD